MYKFMFAEKEPRVKGKQIEQSFLFATNPPSSDAKLWVDEMIVLAESNHLEVISRTEKMTTYFFTVRGSIKNLKKFKKAIKLWLAERDDSVVH